MGFADVGQIGIGVIEERPYQWPQVIKPLDKVKVIDLVSGMDHLLALSSNGDVYAWGLGGYGQLGAGPIAGEGIIAVPQKIEHMPPLSTIFSGADHSGGVDGTLNTKHRCNLLSPLIPHMHLSNVALLYFSARKSLGLGKQLCRTTWSGREPNHRRPTKIVPKLGP